MALSQHGSKVVLIRPRIYIGDNVSIGPGKIDLLKAVDSSKSISGAARLLGFSYKRAWSLIDTLNKGFEKPVVEAVVGGKRGGGTILTPLGRQLIKYYDSLEKILIQQHKKT